MGNVVLHIGLHKTATRFVQRAILSGLESDRFLVNPEPLTSTLRRAMRLATQESRDAAVGLARAARDQAGSRTLVISEPSISGDMYSSHANWRENLCFVHALFPEATILYFVRAQADWLQSAYRQSLAKGRGVSLKAFLNFRNGAFTERPARFVGGARTVNALDLAFLDIYHGYAATFGAQSVYLFRQQDLRHRAEDVYARLAEALGVEQIHLPSGRISANRAFSALAIHLLFPGVYFAPKGVGKRSGRFAWSRRLKHRMRRIRTAFIQHVFDRVAYVDWDMLERGGMRDYLEQHYAEENEALARVAREILARGPSERASALACVAGGKSAASAQVERNGA